jgi:hypothetical protein
MLGGGGAKPGPDGGPIFGESGDTFHKGRLQDRMERATLEVQRQVLLTACEFAIAEAGLDHPLAQEALTAVREGRPFPPDRRQQLRQLADEFDARYIKLDALTGAGQGAAEDARTCFRRYVAGNALYFATSDDPIRDAHHTVYDASHTSDDPAAFVQRIEELLR